jgi:hypothetical protein
MRRIMHLVILLLLGGLAVACQPAPTVTPLATTAVVTGTEELAALETPTAEIPLTVVPAAPTATLAPTATDAPSATTQPPAEPAATATPEPITCTPTQPDMLGPFYTPGAPVRDAVGSGYVLSGVVRSAEGCEPIAGAQIEFWMAGPDGEYSDDYRATVVTGADGRYRFESHAPPPYSGRPPHHHLRVSAPGFQPLVTQYYPAQGQTEATFDLVLLPDASPAQ